MGYNVKNLTNKVTFSIETAPGDKNNLDPGETLVVEVLTSGLLKLKEAGKISIVEILVSGDTNQQVAFEKALAAYWHKANNDYNPLSICGPAMSQEQTPESPVIFDAQGVVNKRAKVKTTGACRIELWGSLDPTDPNYTGLKHWSLNSDPNNKESFEYVDPNDTGLYTLQAQKDPISRPVADAEYQYLTTLQYIEPKTQWVEQKIVKALAGFRWIKFDFIEGAQPKITLYAYGT